jgi:hypothetical protein
MVEMEGTAEISYNEVRQREALLSESPLSAACQAPQGAPDNTDRLMFAYFGTPRDTSSVTLSKGGP